ncbi:hypothetical protein MRX96_014079 [Rhipicephalus microplus]
MNSLEKKEKTVALVTLLHVRPRATSRTRFGEAERKPASFCSPSESASTESLRSIIRHSCGTEEYEEEQRCSGTERRPFNAIHGCLSGVQEGIARYDSVNHRGVTGDIRKTSAQRSCETEEDEEERFSGTERRPFNTIRSCSSGDHDSIARYDSVNHSGVTGDIRKTSTQRSCETEEDEEEKRCSGTERRPFNTIRGCSSGDHDRIARYDSVNHSGVNGDIRKTSTQRFCGTEEDEEEKRCSGTERRPFNTIRSCSSGDHDRIARYDSVNHSGVNGDIRKTSTQRFCGTEEDEEEQRCSGTERRPFNAIRGCLSGVQEGIARTRFHQAERKPASFCSASESCEPRKSAVHLQGPLMKLQEDESLGERSEDTSSSTFPALAKGSFETDGDDDDRCSGTDRLFDSIHGCSNDDHDNAARYDCVNCRCDAHVTFGATTVHEPRTPCHQSSNAFAIEDVEEESLRTLRGHFVRRFGTRRPFGRRFSIQRPGSGLLKRHSAPFDHLVAAANAPIANVSRSEAPRRQMWHRASPIAKATLRSSPTRSTEIDGGRAPLCRIVGATHASIGVRITSALAWRPGQGRRRCRRRPNKGSENGTPAVRFVAANATGRR